MPFFEDISGDRECELLEISSYYYDLPKSCGLPFCSEMDIQEHSFPFPPSELPLAVSGFSAHVDSAGLSGWYFQLTLGFDFISCSQETCTIMSTAADTGVSKHGVDISIHRNKFRFRMASTDNTWLTYTTGEITLDWASYGEVSVIFGVEPVKQRMIAFIGSIFDTSNWGPVVLDFPEGAQYSASLNSTVYFGGSFNSTDTTPSLRSDSLYIYLFILFVYSCAFFFFLFFFFFVNLVIC